MSAVPQHQHRPPRNPPWLPPPWWCGGVVKVPAAPTSLVALADVVMSDPLVVGQVLTFDGSEWVNRPLPPVSLSSLTDVVFPTVPLPGEALLYNGSQWVNAPLPKGNVGTVTAITAGLGLTGGTITGVGTIGLAATGVIAGSYTNADITVDGQGRIVAAASGGEAGGGDSGGTVTSVTAGTNLEGGTITTAGTISLASLLTGVTLADPLLTGDPVAALGVASKGYVDTAVAAALAQIPPPGPPFVISSPATGEVLTFDGTNWVNAPVAAGGGAAVLTDLGDVSISNVSYGNLLMWNGTRWVNSSAVNNFNAVYLNVSGPSNLAATVTIANYYSDLDSLIVWGSAGNVSDAMNPANPPLASWVAQFNAQAPADISAGQDGTQFGLCNGVIIRAGLSYQDTPFQILSQDGNVNYFTLLGDGTATFSGGVNLAWLQSSGAVYGVNFATPAGGSLSIRQGDLSMIGSNNYGYVGFSGNGNNLFNSANAAYDAANNPTVTIRSANNKPALLVQVNATPGANSQPSTEVLRIDATGNINVANAAHLLLGHDPTLALEAATKQYVDNAPAPSALTNVTLNGITTIAAGGHLTGLSVPVAYVLPQSPAAANIIGVDVAVTMTMTIPAGLVGSQAICSTPSVAGVSYQVRNYTLSGGSWGSGTTLGTLTFAAGSLTGSFSGPGGTVNAGDILELYCAADPDLGNVGVTVQALRA